MSEAEAQVTAPEPDASELPAPEIQNMIQHAMDNEFSHANNIFNDMMTVKLNDILDQEQVRLADQIYNGVEDNEEDVDPNDDQLELDLETESEFEEGESGEEETDEVEEEDEMTDEEIDEIIDNMSDEELAELDADIDEEENSSE